MLAAALIGFTCGFVFSMPVAGPISLLVFGRGLQDRPQGIAYLAVGSAIAESVYAYFAFWGFSALLSRYAWIEPVSRGLTAVLLIALGVHFARMKTTASPPPKQSTAEREVGRKRSFFLGLTITALNPTLMATWGAAVAALHSFDIVSFGSGRALPFSIGVCVGISSWFALLLRLLKRYKSRFAASTLDRTVRVMGVLLTLFGSFFAARFVLYFYLGRGT